MRKSLLFALALLPTAALVTLTTLTAGTMQSLGEFTITAAP